MEDSEERERGMEQGYGIDVTLQPITRKSIGTLMYQRYVRTSDGKTTQTPAGNAKGSTDPRTSFVHPTVL